MAGGSTQPSTINEAIILQRLDNIEHGQEEMKCALREIPATLHANEARRIEYEVLSKARQDATFAKIDLHDTQFKDHTERLKTIDDRLNKYDKIIDKLNATNTILAWIAGVVGFSVVSTVIALITGQATIIFK